MRLPTRVLGLLTFAGLLIAILAIVRWSGAQAQEEPGPSVASSSQELSSNSGPTLRLVGEPARAAVRQLNSLQDVPLAVGRECPAVLLEDGSVSVWVTVTSTVPLTSITVFDDVGTPDIVEDDLLLSLIEGDLDVDGVLDPGEFWGFAGSFFPAAGAVGDTVYVSGQDETLTVITGYAGCEFLPTPPPPAPTEIPVEPTATAEPTEEAPVDTSFTAAEEGEADEGSFTIAADGTPTVTKTGEATEVPAGEPISFTIEVVNPGPNPIFLANLQDVLPENPGLLWAITATSGEGVCTIEDGGGFLFVNCELGTLTAGETFQVQISSETTFDTCGSVDNQAVLYGALDDAGPVEERAATEFVSVDVICPALEVEKEANGDGVINAGNLALFTVTVRAVEDAFDVFAVDTLPDDLGWTVESPDNLCSVTGNEVFCDIGDMVAGEVFEFSVERTTTAADCGDLVNTAHAEQGTSLASFSAAQVDDPSTDDATITVQCPDVRVEQSPDLVAFSAGEDAVFTVTVTNDGPGRADNVELVNQMAPGIAWTDDFEDGDSGDCDIVDAVLTCVFGAISAGGSVTITLTGSTGPEDCSEFLFNNAHVTAANDPANDELDNFSNVQFAVRCPVTTLVKTALPSNIISAGSTAEYLLAVGNSGSGDAIDVTVTDALPNGVDWEIVSIVPFFEGAVVDCAIDPDIGESSQILECSVERIPPGDGLHIFVDGPTDVDNCDSALQNSASVSAANEVVESGIGTASVTEASATITVQCPDLTLTKTAADTEISAGETASYTLTMTNNGPGTAFEVSLSDTLPAGVSWDANLGDPPCSIAAGVLTCDIGNLAPTETFTVTVEGATSAANCGDLANSATLVSSNDDTKTLDPVVITVLCPDLRVVKSAVASEVTAGQNAAYTIEVFNDGDGDAFGVTLTDTLPSGVVWSESPETLCEIDSGVLRCEIGTISQGSSFPVTVQGETDPADCNAPLTNSAEANSTNNGSATSGTIPISVECPALSVTKNGNGPISAGETASYVITVANSGDGIAIDVTLQDPLPAGIEWTEESDDCGIDGPILFCEFGDLATDGSASVTISGGTGPEDCGSVSNSATAEADNHEGTSSPTATITVNCPDLLLTKDVGDGEISAGETASYAVTVSNIGPGTATGVTVEDTPPDGINWTDNSDDCAFDGDTLFCDFGDLGPAASAAVTISGTSGPEDCGELSNTATADATNDDPVTTDPAIITILCPGVAMTKTADAGAVAAGDAIGFTLTVTNPQIANAFDVSVTDELSDVAGLNWAIDGGADADDCAIDGGVLSCDFGTLPGGQSRTVHIASPTTEESCGTIENTATTEADNEPDNLGGNNTATATVTVQCASISLLKIATDGFGTEIATADVGDTITYLYVVANTGGVPLTDVTVLDDHFPVEGNLCPAGTTLEPNDGVAGSGPDEIVCVGEFLVGEIDITDEDGLTLTNVATAIGVSPLGDEVTATDDATVTINEPKEPCQFPVTFTFTDDIDFVDDEGNVLFTIPAGITFAFAPGEVNEQGGCTMPFTIVDANGNSLAAGTMSIYISQLASAGPRALVTDATLVVEVTEVSAWVVPGVPAPEPEVEEVKATVIVSGPVMEVEVDDAKAVIMVEPELEVPFVKTEHYTISTPVTPNTGVGTTAMRPRPMTAIWGLATMLPALAAVTWYRRRAFFS